MMQQALVPVSPLPIVVFDAAKGSALLPQVDLLGSFAEANRWVAQARAEIEAIERQLAMIPSYRASVLEAQRVAKAIHRQKPFLRRLFSFYPQRREIRSRLRVLEHQERELPELRQELQSAIARVPVNKDAQRSMLAELRLLKKELGLRKREENQAMREIRSAARHRNAQVGTNFTDAFLGSGFRQVKRSAIRQAKESRLAPHESVRLEIEQQIAAVEHAILWVERFR